MKQTKNSTRHLVWLGAMVLLAVLPLAQAQYLVPATRRERPAAQPAPAVVDMATFKREMAHQAQDFRVLQEDFRMLLQRVEQLERERAARDAMIHELQEVIAGYEKRFQKQDRDLQQAEARLHGEMVQTVERSQKAMQGATQQALDAMRAQTVSELVRVEQVAVKAANTANAASAAATAPRPVARPVTTGAWAEITVQPGDTLGAIAQQAGVSLQALRQLNNLKNNTIRVGQKLRVPVAQP